MFHYSIFNYFNCNNLCSKYINLNINIRNIFIYLALQITVLCKYIYNNILYYLLIVI